MTVTTQFSLRENDYVLGAHKIGGNAQSIVKGRWVHHTSFLWDFDPAKMRYLQVRAASTSAADTLWSHRNPHTPCASSTSVSSLASRCPRNGRNTVPTATTTRF